MKKTGYLLYFFLFSVQQLAAQGPSLLSRPCLPALRQGSIRNLLQAISQNTGIPIEYSSSALDTGKLVVVSATSTTLDQVLHQVLKGEKITLVEKNGKIILSPSATAMAGEKEVFYSLFGFVKDAASREPLPDASIYLASGQEGTVTNNHGYFTFLLPAGKQRVVVSYAGYTSQLVQTDLAADARTDILLTPKMEIAEVTVLPGEGSGYRKGSEKLETGGNAFNMMLGEPDIVRSIDLLPGISIVPEISSGMLVRGGSPDQNILLLDGNTVFNPTHMLGTVSIINQTSLKSFHLYKSSFPARYGGALSSVMDVSTKDGNMQHWKGEANAGLLAGSFTVEGPVKKDRTAVMIAFRNSWINPFLRLVNTGFDINFYDFHFKLTQIIGPKDKLMLNVYAGHDKLRLLKDNINNQQQWGNKAASLAWNHVLGARAFVNSSVNFSRYENIGGFRYSLSDSAAAPRSNRVYNTFSSVQQFNMRSEAEINASNRIRFNFGAKLALTRIRPFNTNVAFDFADDPDAFRAFPTLYFSELSLFYENSIRVSPRLFLRPGLHLSGYQYGRFHYPSLQPRFYASYSLSHAQQLSFSYNHMAQNLHLVTNPYLGINSDAWVPSTAVLRPEQSDMINAGYRFSGRKGFVIGADLYYKKMRNVTNYIEGKNLFLNNSDWERSVQPGKGWSYGLEVKADKRTAHWQTELSYALSWNERRFPDVNNGMKFPFKYDRRHMLNLTAVYTTGRHWDFSALWSFSTGDVYSLPDKIYSDFDVAQQIIDPLAPQDYRLIYHSSAVNQYRTLPYHRMDVSSVYHHRVIRNTRSSLTLGVYNVYGSPSQYLYDLEGMVGKKSLIVTSHYKFFGITPYLAYSIVF